MIKNVRTLAQNQNKKFNTSIREDIDDFEMKQYG